MFNKIIISDSKISSYQRHNKTKSFMQEEQELLLNKHLRYVQNHNQ